MHAKQALADGDAVFETHFTLLLHFAQSQQWQRVAEHFEALRAISGAKPGFVWLEDRLLAMTRKNEELKQRILERAGNIGESYVLAEHLRQTAQHTMQANELLELLERLKPAYEAKPERTGAMDTWRQQTIHMLRNAGRQQDALTLAKTFAEARPHNLHAQTQYAQALQSAGDYAGAYAWIDRVLKQDHWLPAEALALHQNYASMLQSQQRFDDAAKRLGALILMDPAPAQTWPYQQYLSALVQTNKLTQAHELAETWLTLAEEQEVTPVASAKLWAASAIALGRIGNHHANHVPERFHEPLTKVVRKLALDSNHEHITNHIMTDWRFTQTDACRRLRGEFAEILVRRSHELEPRQLQRLIRWIAANDPAVETETWRTIANGIVRQWESEQDPQRRQALAHAALQIFPGYLSAEEHVEFRLQRLRQAADETQKSQRASELLQVILTFGWTAEYEDLAFQMLWQLPEEDWAATGSTRIQPLLQLDSWILTQRVNAEWNALPKKEEMSRTELAAARRGLLQRVREKLSQRLTNEVDKADDRTARWMVVERLYLDVLTDRDPNEITAECWEELDSADPLQRAADAPEEPVELALFARILTMLEYLATRDEIRDELRQKLLDYLDSGIAAQPEVQAWKEHKYRLLLALDDAENLEKTLQTWIQPETADNRWRITLGYLHAEHNRLQQAIELFEAVENADELGPREYRVLADWYLVRDAAEDRRRAMLGYYGAMQEHQLSQLIQRDVSRMKNAFNQGVPEDFDPAVVDMFTAIFRKSAHPQNYVWQLSSLYQFTKDFRLLECLPEGIVGQTVQKIYPFLGNMNAVTQHVRDEATADTILAHLDNVRERDVVKSATDQRGLDLLEAVIRRKASEVLNQPGQHEALALQALQRAFKGEWENGERRLMAEFLHNLGRITQESIANEQLSQLRQLYLGEEKLPDDRLWIAHYRAAALWLYQDHDRAIGELEAALTERQTRSGGVLPGFAYSIFDTWIGYLEQRQRFEKGEKAILTQLKTNVAGQLRNNLLARKFRLYYNALNQDGTVSLGTGRRLYARATRMLIDELPQVDHNLRYQLVDQLCHFYSAAHSRKISGLRADLRAFAFDAFDELVPFQTQNYQHLVTRVGQTLRSYVSPLDGLEFLIVRYESEPDWLAATGQGAWQRYGYAMAQYRAEAKQIGALEPRLLRIALAELRQDLETRQQRQRSLYHNDYNYFWSEKRGDFLRAALAVLDERQDSGASVHHIAEYLHAGLDEPDRAISAMIAAHERGILDESARSRLVYYLEQANRWNEAAKYLEELVAWRPENLSYRTRLMFAWFRAKEPEKLLATLQAADAHFHEGGRWSEPNMAAIAAACHQCALWKEAIGYYAELIPLHQRTQPNRGIGNGALSGYYAMLAQCHAELGQTAEAVEASAGAIVSWGSNFGNRANAIAALQNTLSTAPDLDGYAATLDAQVVESGLENPIVRKALGQVYLNREKPAEAIRHLALAVETQPNDAETHQLLVRAHDANNDPNGALTRLLAAIRATPRSIELLRDLGQRFEELGRPADAERARTGIVEALPNESEGHQMLAEIRQQQDRWAEAIPHWEQVAEIRALEPTGLMNLAKAQIHEQRNEAARETIGRLLGKNWPQRFGDVHRKARGMLEKL